MAFVDQGIRNIIDNLSSSVGDAIRMAEGQISTFTSRRPFMADIYEDGQAYFLKIDLPGVTKENVDISLEGGRLTVTVIDPDEEIDGKDILLQERVSLAGSRSFEFSSLSTTAEPSAEMADGVLKIRLQKAQDSQTKKINIA